MEIGAFTAELAVLVLFDIGDYAWIEEPAYPDVPQCFAQAGVKTVHVPIDDAGLLVAAGRKLRRTARLAVSTPSHQFPLGVLMSLAYRMQLLAWVNETDKWIIEDDFGGELRYSGRPFLRCKDSTRKGALSIWARSTRFCFPRCT